VINVGIIGGETDAAGELIRILINHPDVILRGVCSPEHAGKRLDSYHLGLIGDTDLCFTDKLDTSKLNCVFLVGESWQAHKFVTSIDAPLNKLDMDDEEAEDALRIIDMTGSFLDGSYGMVYGFPEYHRKALVRGALRASVPSAVAVAMELALFPMAKNHLLNGRIDATVELPRKPESRVMERSDSRTTSTVGVQPGYGDNAILASQLSTRLDPVAPVENRPDSETAATEIEREMKVIDPSFNGKINLRLSTHPSRSRGILVDIHVPCNVTVDDVKHLYEEAYSDHSFTFPVDRKPLVAEVANTNKCLLTIDSERPTTSPALPGISVHAVVDALVKGSAGNAVHCMNLLFGLSERTGLSLKAAVD
jgi:N-acetyl-gamma-glutamyl-phosphate reductase